MKILQDPNTPQSKRDSSDWLQGYCYQMWRCRHNAYRGDGAFGQFMIVMPEQDAVLAITAETPDMQEEINLVWKYLLPAFKEIKLSPDEAANAKLEQKIKTLALAPPAKASDTAAAVIEGKTFITEQNNLQLQSVSFSFKNNLCTATFKTASSAYTIQFGAGKWQPGETNMPAPSLTGGNKENTSILYPAKITGSYNWKDANTLQLVLRYIESPHTETYTCHFENNKLTMEAARSFDFGKTKTVIQAEAK